MCACVRTLLFVGSGLLFSCMHACVPSCGHWERAVPHHLCSFPPVCTYWLKSMQFRRTGRTMCLWVPGLCRGPPACHSHSQRRCGQRRWWARCGHEAGAFTQESLLCWMRSCVCVCVHVTLPCAGHTRALRYMFEWVRSITC